MKAVISERVKAGPNDPLPRGAAEAEFAYRMARRIRYGIDEIEVKPVHLELRIVEPASSKPAAEPLTTTESHVSPRVAQAIEAVEQLKQWKEREAGITEFEAARIMGFNASSRWIKALRQRDNWVVLTPHASKQPAVYSIDSVIETARVRVNELVQQEKEEATTFGADGPASRSITMALFGAPIHICHALNSR